MQNIKILAQDLEMVFDGKRTLNKVSFDVREGEFLSILGPSGCGKTTILRILIGLLQPTGGNVEYALKIKKENRSKEARKAIREKAMQTIDHMGLSAHIDKYPTEMSGGQQQRVAIARTLVLNPDVILFDEPMSALDVATRLSLRAELKKIQKEFGTTMIYITHDQEEAFAMSDRIMVMEESNIVQLDTPQAIVDAPANDYVRDFVLSNLQTKIDSLVKYIRSQA